jgi:hypothetical protein
MTDVLEITYRLTEHDDGYRVADWFRGGYETLVAAAKAATPEKADAILCAAYRGPDVDGVEAKWSIYPPPSTVAPPAK